VGGRKKEKNQLDQRGNKILGANRAGRNHTKRHGTNGNIFFRNFAEKRSTEPRFFDLAFLVA
jgi:hypothetical protein